MSICLISIWNDTLQFFYNHCRLLGVRIPRDEFYQETPYYDGERNDVQWVEISGSEYSIEELDLIKWLRLYGEVLTPLINNKIEYDWLNKSLSSFKLICKQLFLT